MNQKEVLCRQKLMVTRDPLSNGGNSRAIWRIPIIIALTKWRQKIWRNTTGCCGHITQNANKSQELKALERNKNYFQNPVST